MEVYLSKKCGEICAPQGGRSTSSGRQASSHMRRVPINANERFLGNTSNAAYYCVLGMPPASRGRNGAVRHLTSPHRAVSRRKCAPKRVMGVGKHTHSIFTATGVRKVVRTPSWVSLSVVCLFCHCSHLAYSLKLSSSLLSGVCKTVHKP